MDMKALRAKVKTSQESTKAKSSTASYPFWSAPVDTNSILRFLPFKGEEEGIFWREHHQIPLTFCGIEGHDESQSITIRVPCRTMFGEKDKVVEHIRPLWETDKETARQYYFKKSFAMYGFVQKSPFEEVNTADVRRFNVSNSIFQKIKNGIMDEDMGLESHPCGIEDGTNFIVNKTQGGQYADYGASTWAKKETALTKEQVQIYNSLLVPENEFGITKPEDDAIWDTYYEMFLAAYEGDLYKAEWLEIIKPYGFKG